MRNSKHKPVPGLLDRDLCIVEADELIKKYSPYLKELCDYASNVLCRCETSMKGVGGTPASLIHQYYHMIQTADGIQVLCSKSCFEAAIPLLRSLWECCISIQYILEDDFENRSTAWLACHFLERKEEWEKQDITSEQGKRIIELRQIDKYLGQCEFGEKDQVKVKSQIKMFNKMLEKQKFKLVLSKLSNQAIKLKKWYSINNGPKSIKKLAEKVGRPLEYEFLYSQFSSVTHAKDGNKALTVIDNKFYFEQVRNQTSGEMIYLLTCTYLLSASMMIANKLRPAENIAIEIQDIIKRHRLIDVPS